ncbi:MAG: hypothetical protein JSS62_01015 [Verrucomicrobia bacterium]|nr:hypothetical protein [Verrucomicrobiota bacterium]MBS0645267.1 hypothetical protein [Verrucomicrobiota bacterium]
MTLAILATEQSGEQLGAGILSLLKQPAFGMGGELLAQAGLETLCPPHDVMGITDVLVNLPKLIHCFYKLKHSILKRSPKVVLTIDSPDFFLPLHRALRKAGYKGYLLHLVSPSVWAWRRSRVQTMAATLDHLMTLFPFEAAYYQSTRLPTTYIGHPLAYRILTQTHASVTCDQRPILALFPGSRAAELHRNLEAQLQAARSFPHHRLILCLARESLRSLVPTSIETVMADQRDALMHTASCALATSGTICLELALHGVPTAVTYRLSRLNYRIARHLFRIQLPYFTLPNLILGAEMLPEHVDVKFDPKEVAGSLKRVLHHLPTFQKLTDQLRSHFDLDQDPYHCAARVVQSYLEK